MTCDRYREALSAWLDGEAEPAERTWVDAHLAECAGCRRWADRAAGVTRLARTGPVGDPVDVVDAVLPAAPGPWRGRIALGLRAALAVLGTAQLVLGLLQLVALPAARGAHDATLDGASPVHLWHESAAWNLAVGAAYVWVAARRGRPRALVPILTVFVGVLVLLSVRDVLAGTVEVGRLASHGFLLTGYLVVLGLARPGFETVPPGGRSRVVPPVPAAADVHPGRLRELPRGRSDRDQPAARHGWRQAA